MNVDSDKVYPETSVTIINHVRFQKFRYEGENRPGKRKQNKEFMTLQVRNLRGTALRVCIICVDADTQDKIKAHPNGLIGVGCHDGLYDMKYLVPASEDTFSIVIPYIRIERMRLKKGSKQVTKDKMATRMSYLPSPYKEHFGTQLPDAAYRKDLDKAKVRLAVMVSAEGSCGQLGKLLAVSDVIRDASLDTTLGILKISSDQVPAASGAWVDVFTTDKSPPIKAGEFTLYVTYQPPGASGKLERWVSQETCPGQDCILYNKVIFYKIPPCEPDPCLRSPVKATLHLVCAESVLSCSFPFYYVPEKATTKLPPDSDDGGTQDIRLCRKRPISISRCEPFDVSEITSSVKIKPAFQGTTSSQVTISRTSFHGLDCGPLKTDVQKSNINVGNGDNIESIETILLNSVIDPTDSKLTKNTFMGSTTAHNAGQKTTLSPETSLIGTGINMRNYQPATSCNCGHLSSDFPDIPNTECGSFVQDIGISSRCLSVSSSSVQRPGCHVAAIAGCEANSTCSISKLSKNPQFVLQSAAMQHNSCKSCLPQKGMGKEMPQEYMHYQNVSSDLLEHSKWQQQIVVPPHCVNRNDWFSQKQTGQVIPDHSRDDRQSQAVSVGMNYLKCEQGERRFDIDAGNLSQISRHFQINPDFKEVTSVNQKSPFDTDDGNFLQNSGYFQANRDSREAKYVNQTSRFDTGNGNRDNILHSSQAIPDCSETSSGNQTPTVTSEQADTSFLPGLGTMDTFAQMADNLPSDLLKCLNDMDELI